MKLRHDLAKVKEENEQRKLRLANIEGENKAKIEKLEKFYHAEKDKLVRDLESTVFLYKELEQLHAHCLNDPTKALRDKVTALETKLTAAETNEKAIISLANEKIAKANMRNNELKQQKDSLRVELDAAKLGAS